MIFAVDSYSPLLESVFSAKSCFSTEICFSAKFCLATEILCDTHGICDSPRRRKFFATLSELDGRLYPRLWKTIEKLVDKSISNFPQVVYLWIDSKRKFRKKLLFRVFAKKSQGQEKMTGNYRDRA